MSRYLRGHAAPVPRLLCAIVKENPGIHFRGLGRAANLSSTGQLRHHIDRLGRGGELIEVQDGRFKRFFVPGDHDARVREGLARFARRVPLIIGRLLLERAMNRTELRRGLECADSTLGYHLNRMVDVGDVTRTRASKLTTYSLSDPEFVRGLLVRHAAARNGGPAIVTTAPPGPQTSIGESTAPVGPTAAGPVEVHPSSPPSPPPA